MKKLLKKLLVGAVSATMIVGLFASTAMAATTTQVATLEDSVQSTEISLESIAALNHCTVDDLNTVYDDDGYLTFIGDQLSTDKITNETEAQAFVEDKLSDLLKLDDGDIYIQYVDEYPSSKTGITYYSFTQMYTSTDSEGAVCATKFSTSSLTLGVDKDGLPTVVSGNLTHEKLTYDNSNLRTAEEAEALVKTVEPNCNIYSAATKLIVWDDASSRISLNGSTSIFAYLVYMDNMDEDPEIKAESPYYVYVVGADKNGKTFITGLFADSLDEYDTNIGNVSLRFFDDMEDAGEYTYTVNFDWMNEEDKPYALEYAGGDSLEVKVPVMYCEEDGLYYLGNKEHYITMTNYYDFSVSGGNFLKFNPYVSEDPTKADSWHFKYDGKSTVGGDGYEDDYNYVLGSFAKYVEVVNAFGEKFNMYSDYPDTSYLLRTYYFDGRTYPSELSGFVRNASNAGKLYGWINFNTSPNYGVCLDTTTMCHEFTHGINYKFSQMPMINEPAAEAEAVADMVGYQMAETIDSGITGWVIAGNYASEVRDLGNPYKYTMPKYIHGMNYVNDIDITLYSNGFPDQGGAHYNGCASSYLGYLFVNGTSEDSNEATISTEEGLNMWFEVLYLTNQDTDFTDTGACLKFAADKLGYSDEQKAYMNSLIKKLGFEDGKVDQALLDAENSQKVTVKLDFEDENVRENYYFCSAFMPTEGQAARGGGFENNTEQTVSLDADKTYDVIALSYTATNASTASLFMDVNELEEEYEFDVKKIETVTGETIPLRNGETILNNGKTGGITFNEATEESNASVTVDAAGSYLVATQVDGEYNLYIIEASDAAGHDWDTDYTLDKAATLTNAGQKSIHCKDCGAVKNIEIIPQIKSVKLSATSNVYTGKVQKPSVKVTDAAGNVLTADTDYTVSYSGKCKTAGKYTVTVTFKGNYSGTKTLNYKIVKASQKLKVTTKVKTVAYSKVAKANQTVKPVTKVTGAKGTVSYKITKYANAKVKKYLSINTKTGKVTVKKGAPKGTYRIKVKVSSSATDNFKGKSVTKVIKVKVK